MKTSDIEEIQQYLKDKNVLLATDSSTDRATWKRTLHDMGVKVSNFVNASSLSEACEEINNNDIHIIFTAHIIGDDNMIELVDKHIANFPDRNGYFSFMVTDKNSLAIAAFAAEHEVDVLIIKPYNQTDLTENLKDSFLEAISRSEEVTLYYSILGHIRKNESVIAREKIKEYFDLKPDSVNAYFLKGLLFYCEDKHNQAVELWEEGLKHTPSHHQSLCHIFDTLVSLKQFVRAYPFAMTLADEYPINPERIPNFIRVSLATESYQNLIDFCKLIIEIDDDLHLIEKPIAAALAVSAKHLVDNEDSVDIVKEASLKAIELTDKSSQIFVTCVENLFRIEYYKLVRKILDEIPTEEMSQQLLDIDLLLEETTGSAEKTYIKAQGLIKINKLSEIVFFVTIRTGAKIGKSTRQLEDIVFDAAKIYPHIKGDLLSIIPA